MLETPWYPIVYIRGYAGSDAEVEETVATPYMGFNLGATKYRQSWTGDIERHIFESPLIRLMKDHGYSDVYENGAEIPEKQKVPAKSVWIYRYYEPVSGSLGTGKRPEIEDYAKNLHDFIERIREQVCGESAEEREAFRVYLVAHSMGGLIVRCYLQNICPSLGITPPVDKVFTYATPHGGIDFRLIGNMPLLLSVNNANNFNTSRMREYLKLTSDEPVNSLGGHFDFNRFFSLIGTNARDYAAAKGLSSFGTGPMGDGLVQIENAYVDKSPRAFVHRSHSGHFGIVNSEEGYQNLRRFLFGRVRVDGFLDIDEITLPPQVERKWTEGNKTLRASYHFDVIGRVRQARWDLHRRTMDEHSAVFLTYDDIRERSKNNHPIQLFSTFLLKDGRDAQRRTLGFSIDLHVHVPEYELDGFLFLNNHYEGGYLFREKINLLVSVGGGKPVTLKYGFDSRTPNRSPRDVGDDQMTRHDDGRYEFRIPISQKTRPGLSGTLVLKSRPWN